MKFRAFLIISLLIFPSLVLADGTATIGGLYPSDTVGVGTHVYFTITTSGLGSPLIYKVIDSFGGGVNNSNIDGFGTVSWTPNNSDLGTHNISITATDPQGNSATASQTITVAAPGVTVGTVSPGSTVRYGTPLTFSLTSSGLVNPQYVVSDSFAHSTIAFGNTSNGVFTWTPLYQDIGTHTLTATAQDTQGHSATATITLTITGPTGVTLTALTPGSTVGVGTPLAFVATTTGFTSPTFAVTDAFTSTLGTSTLAIDPSGKVTWTPVYNDIGVHELTISVTDSANNAATAKIAITVVPATAIMSSAPVPYSGSFGSNGSSNTTAANSFTYTFTKYLGVGSSGADVTALQKLLTAQGVYSGPITGYFGNLTAKGVVNFQTAHGISAVGYVGPATRAALNKIH